MGHLCKYIASIPGDYDKNIKAYPTKAAVYSGDGICFENIGFTSPFLTSNLHMWPDWIYCIVQRFHESPKFCSQVIMIVLIVFALVKMVFAL